MKKGRETQIIKAREGKKHRMTDRNDQLNKELKKGRGNQRNHIEQIDATTK